MKDNSINNPKTDSNLSMLIEHCALHVMRWYIQDYPAQESGTPEQDYMDYYGWHQCKVSDYKPLENIEQAMALLGQLEEKDRCKAIVHAVCKATGYPGDLTNPGEQNE